VASKLLSRLVESSRRQPFDQRPSTQIFPDLNADLIASEMGLARIGRERGANEQPSAASAQFDDVEVKIIERVEAENKAARHLLEDNVRTYAERLASLDFEGRFTEIRHVVPACVGEFRAEVEKGRDELYRLGQRLRASSAQREAFLKSHKINRTARIHRPSFVFLKISLLLFLLVFETVANGIFLSKGSEQGLLGGVTEATSFALLNIGGTLIITLWGIVQLNHARLWRRLIGLLALLFYVAFAVTLNLALAHYREISSSFVEGGGEHVLSAMMDNPFQLHDVNSWVFFGFGILFSLIALLDGLSLRDPYPGLHLVENEYRDSEEQYVARRRELIEELQAVRDEYSEDMDEISRELSVRRGEHDGIVASRARLHGIFDTLQSHLERAGGVLMSAYREANIRARKTAPPSRFSEPFRLERIAYVSPSSGEWNASELRSRILEIQEVLTGEVRSIHRVFEEAMRDYTTLESALKQTTVENGSAGA